MERTPASDSDMGPSLHDAFMNRLPDESLVHYNEAQRGLLAYAKTPEFLTQDRAGREAYVKKYLQFQVPEAQDVFNGLNPESGPLQKHMLNLILGPPTSASGRGRILHKVLAGAGTALGAVAGSPTMLGAGALGAAGYVAGDWLGRQFTDLPDQSFIEKAIDTTLQGSTQALGQGMFNAAQAIAEKLTMGPLKTTILGGRFTLRPQEGQTFKVLGEGDALLGTENTSQASTLTPGQLMTNRGTLTGGTLIEKYMRNSLFGGLMNREGKAQAAGEAVLGKYVRTINATNDARLGASAIIEGYEGRVQIAAQARRAVYDQLGSMSASVPALDTAHIVTPFLSTTRPDITHIRRVLARDIDPGLTDDVFGLLTTKHTGPLSALPATAIVPGMPVTVHGNPGTYVGPGPQAGTVQVNIPGMQAGALPATTVEATITSNEASYANIALFTSIMRGIQRAGAHAAESGSTSSYSAAGEDAISAGRTAGWLANHAETLLNGTTVPQDVKETRKLAGMIYHEENDTFYTPLIQGLIAKFRDAPDTIAQTLLKEANSDTLSAIHKAVEAMPRFNAGTVTDPVQRAIALNADSQYTRGTQYWKDRIQPYLQVGFIRDFIATPRKGNLGAMSAFEANVDAFAPTPSSIVGPGGAHIPLQPSVQNISPESARAMLFSVNADTMLQHMQQMTPPTRQAIFNSEAHFQQLYQIVSALKHVQTNLGDGGSLMLPIIQVGALTTGAGAAAGILGEQAQGNPYLTGAGALGALLLPSLLAAKLTSPGFTKRLIFGIQNPNSGAATRVFTEMSKGMIRFGTSIGLSSARPNAPLPNIPEPEER